MAGPHDNPTLSLPIKRKRSRTPRVRSGCKTWIRHLKCDEAKPTCHRCCRDRVKCDGYDPAPQVVIHPEGHPEHNTIQSLQSAQPPALVAVRDAQDLYFNHAVHCTIRDLTESTTNTSFWVDFLPRSLSQIDATRYALKALGAAHIDFLTRETANCSGAATKHERSVILYYNLAIRHLQPLLSKATSEDIEAALACCILFICVENIRGRYAESLKHLQSGVSLLVSLLVPSSKRHPMAIRKGRLPVVLHQAISAKSHRKSSIDCIAALFSRLSLETHILIDKDVVSLTTVSRPTPELGLVQPFVSMPIMTLNTARDELHLFEVAHDIFYQQTYSDIKNRLSNTLLRPRQQPECFLTLFSENDKASYQQIYHQFWQWSARFDQYMAESSSCPRSSKDLSDASKIRLLQKTWTAILDQEPWTFSGQRIPAFGVLDEFLPEVESIIKLRGPSSRRLFTFGADVLPYIALAGCLTEDMGLLQRIITALKQLDRREGLWDSKDLAEIFEASIIARTELGISIRGSAGGVLHMAKSLSEMNIPCISAKNSIVSLARNIELL